MPKSIFRNEMFAYRNLYAACNGRKSDNNYNPRELHCDAEGAKGNKNPDILNPYSDVDGKLKLQPFCIAIFQNL